MIRMGIRKKKTVSAMSLPESHTKVSMPDFPVKPNGFGRMVAKVRHLLGMCIDLSKWLRVSTCTLNTHTYMDM